MIIRWSNQLQAACRRNEAASVDQEPAASFIDQRQLVKIMKMKLPIEAALRFRIAILYAEKRARDPSKMSKAQQSALISARKKVQRTKHKVEELEAALLAAKENYAGAQKALKVLEDSSVGSSYLTSQLNNTTLSVH